MELKKNPNLDIHKKRGFYFNIALSISLAITLTAFEWKSYKSDYQPDKSTSVVWVEAESAAYAPMPPKPQTNPRPSLEVEMMQIEFAYE